ncbi:MAG: biopolymer transporter ExbD [Proteobacteria bacterium]|nr:MAG: biopolymer transporter ExbD [Pseudomonadota bacterium]
MNFTQAVPDEVEVSLTPLIDVVFLLLIFFMLTTTFDRDAEVKLDLPKSQSAVTEVRRQAVEVLIDNKGTYYIDGQEVLNNKPETLFQAMSEALDHWESTPPLVISADAHTDYQAVITAMDIAGRLGLTSISMVTAQAPRK